MRKIILLAWILIFSGFFSLHSQTSPTSQKWEGTLDDKGFVEIVWTVSKEKPFFLEGWILYRSLYRPVPVFWNDQKLIIDAGPEFHKAPYKIHYVEN